jgi:hypothetical protein
VKVLNLFQRAVLITGDIISMDTNMERINSVSVPTRYKCGEEGAVVYDNVRALGWVNMRYLDFSESGATEG